MKDNLIFNYRKYDIILIPMKNENNYDMFPNVSSCTWVFSKDGKSHGKLPVMIMPNDTDFYGGESAIKCKGYIKHWCVFHDNITDKYTFGNYRSFITSKDPYEREIANNMMVVDIDELMKL